MSDERSLPRRLETDPDSVERSVGKMRRIVDRRPPR